MLETEESRVRQRAEELARIDMLMAEMWEIVENPPWKYNKDGDAIEPDSAAKIQAANTILNCVKQRVAIIGLAEQDLSQAKAAVLIIGGNEADYINSLKGTLKELPGQSTSD